MSPLPCSWVCCHQAGLFFLFFPFSGEGNREKSGYFLGQSSPPEANNSCIRTQRMLQKAQDWDDTALQWGKDRWALKMSLGRYEMHSSRYPALLWVWFVIQVLRSEICPNHAERVTLMIELLEFWNLLWVLKLLSSKSNPVEEVSRHPSKYTLFSFLCRYSAAYLIY